MLSSWRFLSQVRYSQHCAGQCFGQDTRYDNPAAGVLGPMRRDRDGSELIDDPPLSVLDPMRSDLEAIAETSPTRPLGPLPAVLPLALVVQPPTPAARATIARLSTCSPTSSRRKSLCGSVERPRRSWRDPIPSCS